jgi:hypothetical protein
VYNVPIAAGSGHRAASEFKMKTNESFSYSA